MVNLARLVKHKHYWGIILISIWRLSFATSNLSNPINDWQISNDPCNICGGFYLLPITNENNSDIYQDLKNPKQILLNSDQPISLQADFSKYNLDGTTNFVGDVTINQEPFWLHANKITIIRNPKTNSWQKITANGNIQVFYPPIRASADQINISVLDETAKIYNTEYRYYPRHARGQAELITLSDKRIVKLKNADFTTCPPNNETWRLKAHQIDLDPNEGRARAKHLTLRTNNIPVFYWPYLNYPIDPKRHTGFLFPNYGATSNSGMEINLPFYLNLAPNYDATITPRILTERGVQTQLNFRYLAKNNFNNLNLNSHGKLDVHFLPNDHKYKEFKKNNLNNPPGGLSFLDPRVVALDTNDNRLAANFNHTTNINKNWRLDLLFQYVSDDNYFVDLGNDIYATSLVQLPQKASLEYSGNNWTHKLNVEEYQVLQPLTGDITKEVYKRQPEYTFLAYYPQFFNIIDFTLDGALGNYAHNPEVITGKTITYGQRFNLRSKFAKPFSGSFGYITPRVQLDWLQYNLQLGEFDKQINSNNTPNRLIPIYDITAGVFFDKYFANFIQTIEPKIYYLYVPFRNQRLLPNFDSGIITFNYSQLFKDNRFSGKDRIGDANQLTLAISTRTLSQDKSFEWFNFKLGQIFYFTKQKVSLCENDIFYNTINTNPASLNSDLTQNYLTNEFCILNENPKALSKHSNLLSEINLDIFHKLSIGNFNEFNTSMGEFEQAAIFAQYSPSDRTLVNLNYYWQRRDLAKTDLNTGKSESLHQSDFSLLLPITPKLTTLARWHYDLKNRQNVELLWGLEYNSCCIAFQGTAYRYRLPANQIFKDEYANGVFLQVVFKGLSSIGLNHPDNQLSRKIPGYKPFKHRTKFD